MARQNITFTELKDEWLKPQIGSEDCAGKSEVVNDLIRQARKQQLEMKPKSKF